MEMMPVVWPAGLQALHQGDTMEQTHRCLYQGLRCLMGLAHLSLQPEHLAEEHRMAFLVRQVNHLHLWEKMCPLVSLSLGHQHQRLPGPRSSL